MEATLKRSRIRGLRLGLHPVKLDLALRRTGAPGVLSWRAGEMARHEWRTVPDHSGLFVSQFERGLSVTDEACAGPNEQ